MSTKKKAPKTTAPPPPPFPSKTDPFAKRAEAAFWDVLAELVDWLHAKFPDCEQTEDFSLLLHNVVLDNEQKRRDGIVGWYDCMVERLDPKHVRYTKPLDRLFEAEPGSFPSYGAVVHACAYRDIEAVHRSSTSPTLSSLGLHDKLTKRSHEWTDGERSTLWRYVDDLTRNCFVALGKAEPRQPTKTELAAYLAGGGAASSTGGGGGKAKASTGGGKSRTGGGGGAGAMNKALLVATNALMESRGSSFRVEETEAVAWKARLVTAFSKRADGGEGGVEARPLSSLVADRDPSCLPLLASVLPEAEWDSPPLREADWKLLSQMASLVDVDSTIPSGMIEQIEGMASRLADDFMSGNRSLSDMNVEKLGHEMMRKFDKKDMEKLAGSMDKLMPAIDTLRKNMSL